MSISITKSDGTKVPFNADQINKSIERACRGMQDPIAMVIQIATETQLTLYNGITTDELDQATINAAIQNIQFDTDYDKVATRLFLKTIYRHVVGEYDKDNYDDFKNKHRDAFRGYIEKGIADGRLDTRMANYDLEKLADALRPDRDELFQYAGVTGLMNRYALRTVQNHPRETPQFFFMRVAMGLAYNESDPTGMAIKFYNKMSKFEYLAGGSTNVGAGTTSPALSNCYLLEIHDDLGHIAKSVADVMLLSKGSGGIGASLTKLRAAGSPLRSNNGASTGPTPFAKIIDTAIRAIQRGGKKKGALCFYIENWHIDFPEFLDWKHNAGDDYLRMRTANTAVWISDEFMKRVRNQDMWYMFDPAETPDLNELYGSAFSKRYAEYITLAEAGKMRTYKKVPAEEQLRQILVALQTTSHPWLTWKDTVNNRALNNNTGTIHMSNLCTEICLPQDRDNVAVCNLASLNLSAHVKDKEVQWGKLEESVRLAIRQLDNLIDINKLPIPEAKKSDAENRAVGLGIMGFSEVIERMGMAYDSEAAYDFADKICEFISYMAIDESANLARERGAYKHFAGSEWSKGRVPIDTIDRVELDRGMPVTVVRGSKHKGLNWDLLREKVRGGMRNATLMAVAPNANIGLMAGTTPGIDPRFAQVFARNKISGKYMDLNHNLVRDLKNLGLWENVRGAIIEHQGDIAHIDGIPQHLKEIYKTSFTTSPYAFIEVAARAQKWIDQALSRNMYLETRDIDETLKIYSAAWEKGVKTTYYLHMKPRHTAEQSTVRVNKAEKMGKKGFGSLSGVGSNNPSNTVSNIAPVTTPVSSPISTPAQPYFVPTQQPSHVTEPVHGFASVSTPTHTQPISAQPRAFSAPLQKSLDWNINHQHVDGGVTQSIPQEKPQEQPLAEQLNTLKNAVQQAMNNHKNPQQDVATNQGGFSSITRANAFAAHDTAAAPRRIFVAGAAGHVHSKDDIAHIIPDDPAEKNICDSCQ